MTDLISGEFTALSKRAITEETCRHWGYKVGQHNGRPVQIATYCDDDGVPVAQKLRFPDKDFKFIGEPKRVGLYGQHLWRDGGKKVVVTEGEIDALTVSQLQGNKWPVVSVPNGAQGAAKSVAKSIEWLNKFDQVVFLFDDDEPGRAAAKECAALLPPGKAFIGRIAGFKDAAKGCRDGYPRLAVNLLAEFASETLGHGLSAPHCNRLPGPGKGQRRIGTAATPDPPPCPISGSVQLRRPPGGMSARPRAGSLLYRKRRLPV
jgi:hypothetical protein